MQLPEYHQHEEFLNRSAKLKEIKELGIDPYPHKFTPDINSKQITDQFADSSVGTSEEASEGKTPSFKIAGRLVLFRAMGKNAFGHIQDEEGRTQVMFNKELTLVNGLHSEEITSMKFIEKKIDLGDILGVEGNLFRTQKGELTLFIKKVTLLCKTLLPLPEKHSGLVDKGVRYRKRWLDLISHQDVLEQFKMRSKILELIRSYFKTNGFLEVETPVLQNVYGGAQARPFTTQLNALDQEMFLRISLEIPLKKLLVGGLSKVYEIGKVFRNEGLDRTHNPEFTELEVYAAYWDYNDMMKLTEDLFELIALELYGKTKLTLKKDDVVHEVELKAPWIRMSMKESIKTYANIDVDTLSLEQMKDILIEKAKMSAEDLQGHSKGQLIAAMFEEFAEEHLIQPHHIIDHPIETTPLCKLHRNEDLRKERFVERFETFIMGSEFCNSYSELNDPELQRQLLVEQSDKRLAGDEEACPLDEEFMESICQGMPPAGGLGIGVDRLVMLFLAVHSIRDVLLFPIMKPEEG
jgi:lysyl-tRNA synthetase, class II